MTTYCAIHVKTKNAERVLDLLGKWWQQMHGSNPETRSMTDWPPDFQDDFLPDEIPPSSFGLAHMPSGWVTIHYNSFDPATALCRHFSTEIGTLAITVIYQSVSEAYFVEVMKNGRALRTLAYAGDHGEWLRQEGVPLPFETVPLGTNLSEGSTPWFVFTIDDLESYCHNLGLDLWSDHYPEIWWHLSGDPRGYEYEVTRASRLRAARKRSPWWKFW